MLLTPHVAGSDTLKIGLVGCGGRGTGAASQALRADSNVILVALGDAFGDRLSNSLDALKKDPELGAKLDVPPERCFTGFEAYKKVIAASDVVLLCTPPHFRPMHLKAAIDAGKHVFAEKPVAVDAPGVRSVLATCAEAKKKKLSVVSGLCLRYSAAFKEMVGRIHEGQIGEVLTVQANDYRGPIWVRQRQPEWGDVEYQMRNWYYYTWLSGDFNVEQHVHFLDVCTWVMREQYPVRAFALGGRQQRTGREYGHIYDHFAVAYEYANGSRLYSQCRQQKGCANEMSAWALGTRGRADINERRMVIHGATPWTRRDKDNDFYQAEHDALFASIRGGQPINNGDYMAKSTLLAIMGRMAAYTGQVITWDMAMNSKEDLTPPSYDMKAALAEPPAAIPGTTKFL